MGRSVFRSRPLKTASGVASAIAGLSRAESSRSPWSRFPWVAPLRFRGAVVRDSDLPSSGALLRCRSTDGRTWSRSRGRTWVCNASSGGRSALVQRLRAWPVCECDVRCLAGGACPVRAGCAQRRSLPSLRGVERVSFGRGISAIDRGGWPAVAPLAVQDGADHPVDSWFLTASESDPADRLEAPDWRRPDTARLRLARCGRARPAARSAGIGLNPQRARAH